MSEVRLADLGDFLPLIILILISAWANHAKKKKEEELARKQAEARRKSQGGQAAEARPAQPQRPQPVQQVEEEEDEDWTAGEWEAEVPPGEAPYATPRGEDRGAIRAEPERHYDPMRKMPRDHRAELRDRVPPGPVQAKPEKTKAQAQDRGAEKAPKAAETAKDFLTQIAKELGLELPPGTAGKPAPKPQAPKPAPPPPPPPRPSYHVPSMDEARMRATDAIRSRPTVHIIDDASPYGKAAIDSVRAFAAAELGTPEALRQAFILKTILDKPLARRPRSHGPLTDR